MLIAIEGISGSGKSTFADALELALRTAGVSVYRIGGMQRCDLQNPINEFIRQTILNRDRFLRLPFWAETYLLLANMCYNSVSARQSGSQVVIRENYVDALRAFQYGRATESQSVSEASDARHKLGLLAAFAESWRPDLVYWIRTDVQLIAERLRKRAYDANLPYHASDAVLQQRIDAEYERILKDRENVQLIENNRSEDDIRSLGRGAAESAARLLGTASTSIGRIYIAGPLFTPGERIFLEQIDFQLQSAGYRTYLPHRDGGLAMSHERGSTGQYFASDIAAIQECAAVVAVVHGPDTDSGTAWEVGYAHALGRPILGVYEDTRFQDLNLMIVHSTQLVRREALVSALMALVGAK